MELQIRPAQGEERRRLFEALGHAFSFDDPDGWERFAETASWERTRCAFEGRELVGSLGAYPLQLTVPGAVVPTAGTTWITVRPTHRRRGVLREMMRAHFEDVRERGEPLAALWASEAGIYRRFGYGVATEAVSLKIERAHSAFSRYEGAPGALRLVSRDEAMQVIPPIYAELCGARPGHFSRSEAWWVTRSFHDPPSERGGATAMRFVLYEEDGAVRGFAKYRTRGGRGRLSGGTVRVLTLEATTGVAEAALWRYLLDIDLMREVETWSAPPDTVLLPLLADPRRLERSPADGLWVRVVDAPAALAMRRYSLPGRLVFELRDESCPWNAGVYALEVDGDRGRCEPTREAPELRLAAEDLGSVYLGGGRLSTLARAGRVDGGVAALARADAMFAWDPLPWCPEVF